MIDLLVAINTTWRLNQLKTLFHLSLSDFLCSLHINTPTEPALKLMIDPPFLYGAPLSYFLPILLCTSPLLISLIIFRGCQFMHENVSICMHFIPFPTPSLLCTSFGCIIPRREDSRRRMLDYSRRSTPEHLVAMVKEKIDGYQERGHGDCFIVARGYGKDKWRRNFERSKTSKRWVRSRQASCC